MLLEFLKYATRLLKYNMTTIILGTTTTATATATITTTTTTTTNFNITTNASTISSNILNATPFTNQFQPTQHQNSVMLPERPAATYPTLETFNSTLKTLFNKTIDNVAQANLSNYTDYTNNTPYTIPNTLMPPIANASVDGAVHTEIGGPTPTTTLMSALSTLPATRYAMETTTSFPAQTVATFMAAGNKNRATIIVYPTVSPESIVIPIVSCIFGFPILAFLVICCLRRRAKLARERDRRRNYDMQDHAVSLVRFSPIHRLNYRQTRAISLRPERSLSQGFTSLELDTVVEERCSDIEQTQTEILNAESPMETTSSYKMSFSS